MSFSMTGTGNYRCSHSQTNYNPTFGDNCVVTFNSYCHCGAASSGHHSTEEQLRGRRYPQHSWYVDESARDEWHRHNPTMRDPQFSSRRSDSSDAFRSQRPRANTWDSDATSPTLTRSHLADARTEEKTMLDSQSAAGCSVATSKVRTKAEGKEIGCGKPLSTARDLAASNPKLVSPSTRRPMVGSCAHSSERLTGRKRASERQLVNRRSIAEALLRALFTQRLSGWKAEDCSQAYAFCVAFAPVLVAGVSSEQFSEACRRVAFSMPPQRGFFSDLQQSVAADNHSDNDVNEDLTLRKSTRKRKRDTEKSDTKVSALPKKRRVQSSAVGKRGALCSVSAMADSRRSNRVCGFKKRNGFQSIGRLLAASTGLRQSALTTSTVAQT